MSEKFAPPRWPGGARICVVADLGAFDSLKDIGAYIDRWCPSATILAKWKCAACGQWHFWGGFPTNGKYLPIPAYMNKLIEETSEKEVK